MIEVTATGKNTRKEPYNWSESYKLTVEQGNISSVEVNKRLTDIKNSTNKWSTIVANSAKVVMMQHKLEQAICIQLCRFQVLIRQVRQVQTQLDGL